MVILIANATNDNYYNNSNSANSNDIDDTSICLSRRQVDPAVPITMTITIIIILWYGMVWYSIV